jgi:hypothetical protein
MSIDSLQLAKQTRSRRDDDARDDDDGDARR